MGGVLKNTKHGWAELGELSRRKRWRVGVLGGGGVPEELGPGDRKDILEHWAPGLRAPLKYGSRAGAAGLRGLCVKPRAIFWHTFLGLNFLNIFAEKHFCIKINTQKDRMQNIQRLLLRLKKIKYNFREVLTASRRPLCVRMPLGPAS